MTNWNDFDSRAPDFRARRIPRRTRRLPWIPGWWLAGFAAILLLVLGGIVFEVIAVTHTKNVTFTVRDKTVKMDCDSDGKCQSRYLIFTNHGVYQNTDSLWYLKFRSSDLQGNLLRGHTYDCKTAGFRIGLSSTYPNLISCKEA